MTSSQDQSQLQTGLYQPLKPSLKQIRLVEIFPATSADDNEPIQLGLTVKDLDQAPSYSALSYVWGDPAVTQDVILNGTPRPMTTNLAGR